MNDHMNRQDAKAAKSFMEKILRSLCENLACFAPWRLELEIHRG